MVDDVQRAARKAQESQYRDLCTVSEYRDVTDEKSGLTRKEEIVVLENLPCRLSFESLRGAIHRVVQTDTGAVMAQRVKLFTRPEVNVMPGSKVTVTLSGGQVMEYAFSSVPAVYPTHQEIMLEPFKKWT